jgi:predicted transcriptional regulator
MHQNHTAPEICIHEKKQHQPPFRVATNQNKTYNVVLESLVGTGLVEKLVEDDSAFYCLTELGKEEGKV